MAGTQCVQIERLCSRIKCIQIFISIKPQKESNECICSDRCDDICKCNMNTLLYILINCYEFIIQYRKELRFLGIFPSRAANNKSTASSCNGEAITFDSRPGEEDPLVAGII